MLHVASVTCRRHERGMRVSVRPWEVHDTQRRQLAIVVMGLVVAICFLAVVYELG